MAFPAFVPGEYGGSGGAEPFGTTTLYDMDRAPIRYLILGMIPPNPNPRDLLVEHGHRTDRRAGPSAPFERQPDEAEFPLADERFQIAQAFDVRDVELEARLVDEG